jgi:hypothetical protein
MGNFEEIIFKKKKFSNLLEEIYNNQKEKQQQITILIQELKPLIKDIGDATLIVPLLKEYIDLGLKNDEQLIKMATIIQRATSRKDDGGDSSLTDREKEELLKQINKMGNDE